MKKKMEKIDNQLENLVKREQQIGIEMLALENELRDLKLLKEELFEKYYNMLKKKVEEAYKYDN